MLTTWFRIFRKIGTYIAKTLLWLRLVVGALGAVGGIFALLFSLIFVVLVVCNHGAGNAWGGGRIADGKHFLFAGGKYTEVSASMFWVVWVTQVVMFSGGGLMVLMFAIEGMVWLFGGESYVWGRRGKEGV